jgi:protein SCO1/2
MKNWMAGVLMWSAAAAGWADGGSVYDWPLAWTNQAGQAVGVEQLRGRPQVMCLFFSHCTYACPRITSDLKAVEAALTEEERARTGFVMASFDVVRDTPSELKSFAERMDLPAPRWQLLHGDGSSVEELAALLGVRYRREGEDFAHSNLIVLLDAEGRIVARREGLESELGPLIAALRRLLQ